MIKFTDKTPTKVGFYFYMYHFNDITKVVEVYSGSEGKLRVAGTGKIETVSAEMTRYFADTAVEDYGGFWSTEPIGLELN